MVPETATDDPGRGPGSSVRVLVRPVTGAPDLGSFSVDSGEPRVAPRAIAKRMARQDIASASSIGAFASPLRLDGNVGPRTPSGTRADSIQHRRSSRAIRTGAPGAQRCSRMASATSVGDIRRARRTPAPVGRAFDSRVGLGQTVLRPRLVTMLTTTTTRIAPIIATTIELRSNGPSIGLVLNRTLARNPPTRAPTMPRTMCPMTPSPSSPRDEEAGQVAGDRAEDDPRDDAHSLPPSHPGWSPGALVQSVPGPGT